MVVNAEKIGDGLAVKSEADPRITKIGKFLRATSLDELPQLINVVLGQMSLVGPRPPVPYHPYRGYNDYPNWSKKRFTMKPGITGLSQVTVRAAVDWDERMTYDIEYVEKFNIVLDVKVLFRTVQKMLTQNDIYLQSTDKHSRSNIK